MMFLHTDIGENPLHITLNVLTNKSENKFPTIICSKRSRQQNPTRICSRFCAFGTRGFESSESGLGSHHYQYDQQAFLQISFMVQ